MHIKCDKCNATENWPSDTRLYCYYEGELALGLDLDDAPIIDMMCQTSWCYSCEQIVITEYLVPKEQIESVIESLSSDIEEFEKSLKNVTSRIDKRRLSLRIKYRLRSIERYKYISDRTVGRKQIYLNCGTPGKHEPLSEFLKHGVHVGCGGRWKESGIIGGGSCYRLPLYLYDFNAEFLGVATSENEGPYLVTEVKGA
ncbi:hypothetical protein [Pleionea sediminis]|uniref:hypothetical protein n=1 Tax=Pleionea sediminis TaxID=2569479 RepID=UPI0011858626|nr:hypothetical protein [Pleionea sediminis]